MLLIFQYRFILEERRIRRRQHRPQILQIHFILQTLSCLFFVCDDEEHPIIRQIILHLLLDRYAFVDILWVAGDMLRPAVVQTTISLHLIFLETVIIPIILTLLFRRIVCVRI